jgi:hypothetical protein
MLDFLPSEVRQRILIEIISSDDPIQEVINTSKTVDLTLAGTSRTWGVERQTLGFYTDKLTKECHSSLVITRSYSRMTNHLASLQNSLSIPESTLS